MSKGTIYIHSRRDIANIVRQTISDLNELIESEDWYTKHGISVISEALAIWLDRLHNYERYEAGLLREAERSNANVRRGS